MHELVEFHYQTVFRVLCLDIWSRHDIWMLKFDYLKNEKGFEIKKWNKKHFSLLSDLQNKLAKM